MTSTRGKSQFECFFYLRINGKAERIFVRRYLGNKGQKRFAFSNRAHTMVAFSSERKPAKHLLREALSQSRALGHPIDLDPVTSPPKGNT